MPHFSLATLPAPPFLEHWFLEAPLVPGILLVVLGAVVARVLYRQERGRAAVIAFCILTVAGIATIVVGNLVETERETLLRRTREFIRTILDSDETAARDYLAESVVVTSAGRVEDRMGLGREWMLAMVDGVVAYVQITDSTFTMRGASIDGVGLARTRFTARVQSARYPGPHPTTWEVSWRRDADGIWRITGFNWLTYLGEPPSASWLRELPRGNFN